MIDWVFVNNNSGAIIAIATVVLVIITAMYAYLTHKTVKEMQKARQVAYIEKQLENFYLPLHYGLNAFEELEYTKLHPYTYLAGSEELIDVFHQYIVTMEYRTNHTDEEIGKIHGDLKNDVKNDINTLKKRLGKLG